MEKVREIKDGEEFKFIWNGNLRIETKRDTETITVDSDNFEHSFDDKPSTIITDVLNGSIRYKYWFNHGKKHRFTGPAFISYYDDGTISNKEYWIEGEEISQEEFELLNNRCELLNEL